MATNKLAVWMIFNPIEFVGKEWLKRKEGQPGTLFGWQGIVPAKVKKMGGDIANTILNDLLDVRSVFSKIDSELLAKLLTPKLFPIADAVVKKRVFGTDKIRLSDAPGEFYEGILRKRLRVSIKRVIDRIKADPEDYVDIRSLVTRELTRDKQLVVDLFQRCGRDELKFIVNIGLWGGMALGLLQMVAWLLWTPWWSLAVGGAIVGYFTDYIALKVPQ